MNDFIRLLFYDLETRENPVEVGGWKAYGPMGIACGAAQLVEVRIGPAWICDVKRVTESELFWPVGAYAPSPWWYDAVRGADFVVGWNNHRFDDPLLTFHAPAAFLDTPTLDLKAAVVWPAVKVSPAKIPGKSLGLGKLCEQNTTVGKSGKGEFAPQLFKDGRHRELADYNRQDVMATVSFFEAMLDVRCFWTEDGDGAARLVDCRPEIATFVRSLVLPSKPAAAA